MDSTTANPGAVTIAALIAIAIGLLTQISCNKALAQTGPSGSLVGSLSDGIAEQDAQQQAYKLGYRRGRADQRRTDRAPDLAGKAPATAIYGGLKGAAGQQSPTDAAGED